MKIIINESEKNLIGDLGNIIDNYESRILVEVPDNFIAPEGLHYQPYKIDIFVTNKYFYDILMDSTLKRYIKLIDGKNEDSYRITMSNLIDPVSISIMSYIRNSKFVKEEE